MACNADDDRRLTSGRWRSLHVDGGPLQLLAAHYAVASVWGVVALWAPLLIYDSDLGRIRSRIRGGFRVHMPWHILSKIIRGIFLFNQHDTWLASFLGFVCLPFFNHLYFEQLHHRWCFVCDPSKFELVDEEKSKHVHFRSAKMVFAQHLYTLFSAKWFSLPFLHSFLSNMVFATTFTEFAAASKRYSKTKHLCWEEECHEYDLTAASYFWFVNRTDSFRWFAISSLPPICSLSFCFMGGVGKKVNN